MDLLDELIHRDNVEQQDSFRDWQKARWVEEFFQQLFVDQIMKHFSWMVNQTYNECLGGPLTARELNRPYIYMCHHNSVLLNFRKPEELEPDYYYLQQYCRYD